jgi:hypothetical protein
MRRPARPPSIPLDSRPGQTVASLPPQEEVRPTEIGADSGECCFVTDAEIIRRLKLPEKVGRRVLRELDRHLPNRPRFPQKDPLFGDRRFWPAIAKYFKMRYGVDGPQIVSTAPTWQENFDAPRKTAAETKPNPSPRPNLEAAR